MRPSRSVLRFAAALAVGGLMVPGCGDDEAGLDPSTPFPHGTPPVNSMQVDVSDLSSTGRAPAGLCHGLSAATVAWVNLNVALRLAIPVAAYAACLSQPVVFVGDNTWRWTASGGAGAGAWTAELEATPLSSVEVAWAMLISGTLQGHDRLLWFDGRSNLVARSGFWTYYDPASPATPAPVVRCDWDLPLATADDRLVTFENVDVDAADFGDVLAYELAGTTASISHADVADGTSTIEWDTETGAGMTTPAGGTPCCWGPRPGYDDITCP